MHFTMMGGELTIVRAREKAEKTLGAVFNIRAFHDAVLELGSVPLPVVTARIDRFIAENGRGPVLTRIWSEQPALAGGADAGSSTSQPEETRSAYISMVALVGPNCSPSCRSHDSVDSAMVIAGASEPAL